MKVLIVKVSALGDVVHALPVLAWLKSADREVVIDWLVESSFAPFIEGHPLVRQVHHLDTKRWRKGGAGASLVGAWSVIRTLRRERYDVVLDLQGNAKSGLFTLTSGAPLRYGFANDGVRERLNLLATNRKVSLGESDFHISDRSLAIARGAFPRGDDLRFAGPLPVADAAIASVDSRFAESQHAGPRVVLHYGTTWETKLWPLDCWQELALRLCRERGVRPILTWGNDAERVAVTSIQEATNGGCLVWPRGSLQELTALLAAADLVVGGDTGPVHIAAAVETPTVSIFRVTDPVRNAPRGDRHRAIAASYDCAPCLLKSCDRDLECGRSIPVDAVFSLVCAQLDKNLK